MPINFRAFKEEDLEAVRKLVPHGATEPSWKDSVVLDIDGKVRGFAALRRITRLEPLGADGAFAAALLASYIDGALAQESEYEFYCLDSNSEFQQAVEKHWPVAEMKLAPGKWYVRKR
jgi:hypothetical protein